MTIEDRESMIAVAHAHAAAEGDGDIQTTMATLDDDPLYELMMHTPLLGDRFQNEIWRSTLRNVAKHFGIEAPVEQRIVVVDRRWQWRYAKNIWQNAGIRSTLAAPLRWLRPRARRAASRSNTSRMSRSESTSPGAPFAMIFPPRIAISASA